MFTGCGPVGSQVEKYGLPIILQQRQYAQGKTNFGPIPEV